MSTFRFRITGAHCLKLSNHSRSLPQTVQSQKTFIAYQPIQNVHTREIAVSEPRRRSEQSSSHSPLQTARELNQLRQLSSAQPESSASSAQPDSSQRAQQSHGSSMKPITAPVSANVRCVMASIWPISCSVSSSEVTSPKLPLARSLEVMRTLLAGGRVGGGSLVERSGPASRWASQSRLATGDWRWGPPHDSTVTSSEDRRSDWPRERVYSPEDTRRLVILP